MRALAEELERLNARSARNPPWARRLVGESEPEIRNAAADWQVEFLADLTATWVKAIAVDSELVLPASPDLGMGERTRRITTVHSGQQATTREQTVGRTLPASSSARFWPGSSTTTNRPPSL